MVIMSIKVSCVCQTPEKCSSASWKSSYCFFKTQTLYLNPVSWQQHHHRYKILANILKVNLSDLSVSPVTGSLYGERTCWT